MCTNCTWAQSVPLEYTLLLTSFTSLNSQWRVATLHCRTVTYICTATLVDGSLGGREKAGQDPGSTRGDRRATARSAAAAAAAAEAGAPGGAPRATASVAATQADAGPTGNGSSVVTSMAAILGKSCEGKLHLMQQQQLLRQQQQQARYQQQRQQWLKQQEQQRQQTMQQQQRQQKVQQQQQQQQKMQQQQRQQQQQQPTRFSIHTKKHAFSTPDYPHTNPIYSMPLSMPVSAPHLATPSPLLQGAAATGAFSFLPWHSFCPTLRSLSLRCVGNKSF